MILLILTNIIFLAIAIYIGFYLQKNNRKEDKYYFLVGYIVIIALLFMMINKKKNKKILTKLEDKLFKKNIKKY